MIFFLLHVKSSQNFIFRLLIAIRLRRNDIILKSKKNHIPCKENRQSIFGRKSDYNVWTLLYLLFFFHRSPHKINSIIQICVHFTLLLNIRLNIVYINPETPLQVVLRANHIQVLQTNLKGDHALATRINKTHAGTSFEHCYENIQIRFPSAKTSFYCLKIDFPSAESVFNAYNDDIPLLKNEKKSYALSWVFSGPRSFVGPFAISYALNVSRIWAGIKVCRFEYLIFFRKFKPTFIVWHVSSSFIFSVFFFFLSVFLCAQSVASKRYTSSNRFWIFYHCKIVLNA